MGKYASEMIKLAQSWIGKKESDGSHKSIIDIYNSQKKLPQGYKVKYTDSWCATTVSALAVKLGYTDIIPTECSCQRMIELCKEKGIWIENENRTPKAGEIIFYDWEDDGKGDNKGWSDHVGLVEKVSGKTITVIEGNYSNSVKRRTITVNAKNIRGYAAPKYDAEPVKTVTSKGEKTVKVELNVLKKGAKGEQVKTLQRLLVAMGYDCGKAGVDGSFGTSTDAAVRKYQKDNKLTVDGSVGQATWDSLLK